MPKMKIIKLTSENVKRLRAVEITPTGNVVTIGGRNGAGKTSVLDSIWYALAGGKSLPEMPVRKGAKHATVEVDLDDLVVRRTFTATGGTSLAVMSKDGVQQKSPQAILDALVGKLTFDPLEFSRQQPREQAETLRVLVGLDFQKQDQEREALFNARTTVNREVKALQGSLTAFPQHSGIPAEEVSLGTILEEQQKAAETNRRNDEARRICKSASESVVATQAIIKDTTAKLEFARQQVKTLEESLEHQRQLFRKEQSHAATLEAEAAKLQDIDLGPFKAKASEVESTNRKVRENKRRAETAAQLRAKSAEADKLTRQLEDMDNAKSAAISAAKFPVPGLAFDEMGAVTLNGIPFSQASAAEQLRVSVAIGIALNPKLRVLLIRDGSLLDEANLQVLGEMAAKADAQIWLEVVRSDGTVSVVIEDGQVAEASKGELAL